MDRPVVEHLARTEIEAFATVGDLRRALEDDRIPDGSSIIFVEMNCVNVPASDDYDVAALEAGVAPFEHVQTVDLVAEWELDS